MTRVLCAVHCCRWRQVDSVSNNDKSPASVTRSVSSIHQERWIVIETLMIDMFTAAVSDESTQHSTTTCSVVNWNNVLPAVDMVEHCQSVFHIGPGTIRYDRLTSAQRLTKWPASSSARHRNKKWRKLKTKIHYLRRNGAAARLPWTNNLYNPVC